VFYAQPGPAVDTGVRIDAVVADEKMYEPGEPRPSPQAVAHAKRLISSAARQLADYRGLTSLCISARLM
jgi:hypothetical protein